MLFLTGLAAPASAQLADNLASYDDASVEGYLKPFQGALGQGLNMNFFTTADIPQQGFHARFDIKVMSVFFKDADDTFVATTGGDFTPVEQERVSTAVGPGQSVTVPGDGGTEFIFPGGLDMTSLSLGVPQLTVGGFKGTELFLRWLAVPTETDEIGDVSTFGLGARHSISQYIPSSPFAIAGAIFYQTLSADTDLLDVSTFSIGVHGSYDIGMLTALAGLSYDTVSMSSTYVSKTGAVDERITVDFDSEGSIHFSLGVALVLGPVSFNVSGDLASRTGVAFGLGAGF
jgi:hypothetical protein